MSKSKRIRKQKSATANARNAAVESRSQKTPPTQELNNQPEQPPMSLQDPQPNIDLSNPPYENQFSTNGETANSDAVEPIIETPMMAAADVFAPEAVAESVFSEAEFAEFFMSLFPTVGMVAGMIYPPQWQSLIDAPNLPTARPAAGALYRMALKHPWLRFLIEKETEWMKDIALIAGFGVTVGMGVRAEYISRNAPKPEPAKDETVA